MASARRGLLSGIASGAHRPRDTLTSSGPGCLGGAVGAPEYLEVENRSTGGKRRRVRSGGPHSLNKRMTSQDLEHDPIASSDDELQQPQTHMANSTFINKTRNAAADGADSRFFTSHSQQKGQKRKIPPSNDSDELGLDGGRSKPQPRPAKRVLTKPNPKVNSASLSQRGAIVPTAWPTSPPKVFSVRVRDAVCQQHHVLSEIHPLYTPKGECLLQPVPDGDELRAFQDNNQEMTSASFWLKIGQKTKKASYNDRSPFIKIHQASEDNHKIGQLMVLYFFNPADAGKVINWMRQKLRTGVKIEEEQDCRKLPEVFKRVKREVMDHRNAIEKRPNSAHDQDSRVVEQPAEPPRPSPDTPRVATTSSGKTPTIDKILLRGRMEVSSSNTEEQKRPDSSDRHPSQASAMWARPTSKDGAGTQVLIQDSPGLPSANLKTYGTQGRALRPRQSATDIEIVEDDPEPPPRWSEKNPGWSKDWKMPLTLRRTTVDVQDIPRLDEGEFLNDNLLNFGLQWLFDNAGKSDPNLLKRVYMFNTFFYTKLKSARGRGINYDGVKSWTSRVDLFSYDYIIVPVNERFHWWLAIICNPRQLDPSPHDAPSSDDSSDTEIKNKADAQESKALSADRDEPIKSPRDTTTTGSSQLSSNESPRDTTAAGISQLSINEPCEDTNGKIAGDDDLGKTVVDLDGEDVNMKDAPSPQTLDTTMTDAPSSQLSETNKQDAPPKSPFPKGCSPGDFKILTLDSLEIPHSPAVTALKTYLIQELKDKKKTDAKEPTGNVGMRAVNIPAQGNHSDCGVYVLGYMQQFVKDPDAFVHTLLRKEKPEWTIDAFILREEWRDTILIQQQVHQREMKKLQEEEKKAKLAKMPPTPAARKAAEPGSTKQTVHSSPALKKDASGPKVVPSAAHASRLVKETSPVSKLLVTGKPPAQNGEKKEPVTIDLSSPVAKEKSAPKPEFGPSVAVSSSRPSTADSPSRQLMEFRATTPTKGAREPKSQATKPAKVTKEPKPQATTPKTAAKESHAETPPTLGRVSLSPDGVSTTPKDKDKDDSFQEVSPTNFYRKSRPVSHPPSSPPKGRTHTQAQRSHLSASPTQSQSKARESKGMSGWKTLQSPTPPQLPPRHTSPPGKVSEFVSSFFTTSAFAPPKDDDEPVRPSVTKGPRPRAVNRNSNSSMIDLTEDSMEIVEVREVKEGPGSI